MRDHISREFLVFSLYGCLLIRDCDFPSNWSIQPPHRFREKTPSRAAAGLFLGRVVFKVATLFPDPIHPQSTVRADKQVQDESRIKQYDFVTALDVREFENISSLIQSDYLCVLASFLAHANGARKSISTSAPRTIKNPTDTLCRTLLLSDPDCLVSGTFGT